MIVFAPSYDEATTANHAVAQKLCATDDVFLGGIDATQPNLAREIRSSTHSIFAMSHGDTNCLLAHGGRTRALALHHRCDELVHLGERCVFAHACYSARELGPAVSAVGGRYWGYDTAVNAPESESPLLEIFVRVFAFIKERVGDVRVETEVQPFFDELKTVCECARNELDSHSPPMSAYQCLLQIERGLRVWLPGTTAPATAAHSHTPIMM